MATRLAIITPVFPPYHGGMGYVAARHATLMAARGYTVTVYTPWYPNSEDVRAASVEARDGYQIKWVAPSFSQGNAGRITIEEAFAQHDIVHLHYPFYFTAEQCIQLQRKYPKVRFFITYHMDPIASGLKGLYFAWYARFVAPKIFAAADRIFVSTREYPLVTRNAAYFRAHANQVVEAPFGVDQERFHPIAIDARALLREQLGINPVLPTVLFVGGMDTQHAFKGVPVLIEAFAQLATPAQLVLVGDGDLRASFEARARTSGSKNPIHFVGAAVSEQLPQWYQTSDIFVLPSLTRAEAFGLVLLEAMASGVACIASDLPGVASVLEHGAAGLLVRPGDPESLCDALAALLIDGLRRSALATAGRERVARVYTWEHMADTYESWYTVA